MKFLLLIPALFLGLVLGTLCSGSEVACAARPCTTSTVTVTGPTTTVTSTVTTTTPTTTTPEPPPPADWSNQTLGIATGYITDASTDQQFDGLAAVGAEAVRTDCPWASTETSRGVFNWSTIDSAVARANSRGLRFICTPWVTPGWANGGQDYRVPPTDPEDYGRFVEALVRRYSPLGVKVYEIWNEPNITQFWLPFPDPAKYAALVKSAYAHAKAADPTVIILAGAMAPHGAYGNAACDGTADDNGRNSTGITPLDFLEEMYQAGAGGSFDALSAHPYDLGGFGFHPCSEWSQMAQTNPSMRSLMTTNGDEGKKIWGSEWGFTLAWPYSNTEDKQAAALTEGVNLWRSYPWTGPLNWFNYHDNGELFGLTRSDWTKRPAWNSFQVIH